MPSLIGSTVSHYAILEKLGEGGMGVVYKAEDLKLTRTVALKFLPHGLNAHEPERERFLQEARAAAILNHPNICTIHDIQEHEGQQFIVMEYVEGKTLREVVPVKKMHDAITYATQIAEALQEAHTHGIVHRDIKAENIMVNTKNQVKVMDFGLAKLKGSLKLTKTSSTIGTLAYMAPEQIQGGEVDARSDIFSFGIVLYEMLTGHLPFRGEHEAAMVYSIVNEDPEPLHHYVPDAPSELLHVLDRAMEKDRDDRYQTVLDMLIDLRRMKKQTGSVSRMIPGLHQAAEHDAGMGRPAPVPLETPKRLSIQWILLGSLTALVVIVGVLYLLFSRSPLPELNPRMTTRVIEIPFAEMGYPTLSSDGKWIAFAAADVKGTWDFYFMHAGSPDVKRVTFDSSAGFGNQCVSISPDGGQIAYDRIPPAPALPEICIASPLTGESRRLVDSGYGPLWRADGERIGYLRWGREGRLRSHSGKPEFWSARPDGSDKRLELADTASTHDGRLCFAWSPDLKSVAFLSTRGGNTEEVFVRDLRDGSERQLTHLESAIDQLRWAENGWIFFSSNKSGTTNLWMVSPDGGEPFQFTKGTTPYLDVGLSSDCTTLLGYQRTMVNQAWIASLDGTEARPFSTDDMLYLTPSFMSNDRQIAFVMGSGDPLSLTTHLCLMDRDGQHRRQLVEGTLRSPACSPDGKWLAYTEYETSGYTAWVKGSVRACVVSVADPANVRHVGSGMPWAWIDSESFVSWRDTILSSWQAFVDGREQKRLSPDSVNVLPLRRGEQLLVSDLRAATQGLSIGPGGSDNDALPEKLRLIQSFKPSWATWGFTLSPGNSYVLLWNSRLELWRIALPSGQKDRIQRSFPELSDAWIGISNDGRYIVYTGRVQTKSKLVLMEHPFK